MLRVVVVVGSWLCSPPRCGRRRRRRVLCSPPPVGSVSMLARSSSQTKHEGHTGTSDSSILHQNNVNQTSAFGPWLLLLRRGLAQLQILFLTDSQDCTHRHALLSAQLCRRLGGAVQSLGCYFRVPVRCELVLQQEAVIPEFIANPTIKFNPNQNNTLYHNQNHNNQPKPII